MKNLLVAQSGGPTAAINATLVGVLQEAREKGIDQIFGARYGIEGILKGDILNLTELSKEEEDLIKVTPASVLGSCRYKLKNVEEGEEEYLKILKLFKDYDIKYFIYIGGNDSMDTADKIEKYLRSKNIDDVFVVGAPKTIDNDLLITDHCPGFGSAAKYVATTFLELERDVAVYDKKAVTIVETMGRDSGFLTAASSLSRVNGFCGPSLIYCCEVDFSIEKFLYDIENKFKEKQAILIAVSEGVKLKDSSSIENEEIDVFGHIKSAGVAKILERIIKKNLGCKTRSIELNSPQRAAAHQASYVDLEESLKVGRKAVHLAVDRKSGVMVIIKRKEKDQYEVEYDFVELSKVANGIKKMPKEFIADNGCDVTQKAISYLKPLIQGEVKLKYVNGLPVFFKLW